MTIEIPINIDKFLEEAHEVAVAAHGAARDDKDMRTDRITAKLLDMVDHLQRDVVDSMKKAGDDVKDLKGGLARVEAKVAEFMSAFPNADSQGHLRDHEMRIDEARDKKVFWEKMKFTIAALVVTTAVGWFGIVIWKAFLLGPK